MHDSTTSFDPENDYYLSLQDLVNASQEKISIFEKKEKRGKNLKMVQTKIFLGRHSNLHKHNQGIRDFESLESVFINLRAFLMRKQKFTKAEAMKAGVILSENNF